MEVVIVYGVAAIALFVSAFLHSRRFGLLGLALGAGYILSQMWGYEFTLVLSVFGVPTNSFTTAVTLSVLILAPSLLLLFHGYSYKSLVGRLIGAMLFSLLAIAFLIEPLGHILMPVGFGRDVYDLLVSNRELIIGGGLVLAIVDLFFSGGIRRNGKH
jgi:hypothetical protein